MLRTPAPFIGALGVGANSFMSLVQQLPELEAWMAPHAISWEILSDTEYKLLVNAWASAFRPVVQSGGRYLSGNRAIRALQSRLPCSVAIFSGLKIAAAANMGGRGPSGYNVQGLSAIDAMMARELELVVVSDSLVWSYSFSHEEGYEKFYEADPTGA